MSAPGHSLTHVPPDKGQRGRRVAMLGVCAALLVAAPAVAQDAPPEKVTPAKGVAEAYGGDGGLVIGGVLVDVTGKTAEAARIEGWRAAARKAWPRLWARMSGLGEATAPKLADGALDQMVRAIEVEKEEMGRERYVARLAIVFDRARTASYLGKYSVVSTSPPFLLLPVLQDAAVRLSYEPNPWLAAWLKLRPGETPMDYVRIRATTGDRVLLNSWQAGRHTIDSWRNIIERYQVADVVVPELILDRSWAGGPLAARMIVRFGADGRELARRRFTRPDGDVEALMQEAVQQADAIYRDALHAGTLVPNRDLVVDVAPVSDVALGAARIGGFVGVPTGGTDVPVARMDLQVRAPDDATLEDIIRRLRATAGVSNVQVESYAVGGTTVVGITTALSQAALRFALDGQGLRLADGVVRRRLSSEAPLAAPPPPAASVSEAGGMVVEDDLPAGGATDGP